MEKCRKIECRKDDGMERKREEKYGKMQESSIKRREKAWEKHQTQEMKTKVRQ